MATAGLLALLDDIATLLDDVAVLSKIAAKKSAGVLGDDLALNAQQVADVRADRELPVVWAVAKGSLRNKAILVPAALAISAFAPWLVTPLLMVGGLYLCFEGAEKLAHRWDRHAPDVVARHAKLAQALADPALDIVAHERAKVRGAIRTDLILSAEIVAIVLGTVAAADFGTQVAVLSGVALLITVGVYGLVGIIVKIDDAGLHLSRASGDGPTARTARRLGRGLLRAAPWLMKTLSVAGTAAMFLVGGGILTHGLGPLHTLAAALPAPGSILLDAATGLAAGAVALLLSKLFARLRDA